MKKLVKVATILSLSITALTGCGDEQPEGKLISTQKEVLSLGDFDGNFDYGGTFVFYDDTTEVRAELPKKCFAAADRVKIGKQYNLTTSTYSKDNGASSTYQIKIVSEKDLFNTFCI